MSRRELTEWLRDLEAKDTSIQTFMMLRRAHGLADDDLAPENLVGLVEVLVKSKEGLRRELQRYTERFHDRFFAPPMVLMDKNVPRDNWRIITHTADEWPATERALVECSKVIYFRDFLRSFWKRLTGR